MTTKTFDGVDLEICDKGCGGIWFDHREFQKFDEQHESAPAEVLNLKPVQPVHRNQDSRPCPVCEGIILFKRFSSVKREVEIDECANCGGIFLDAGELHSVRSQFKTDEERKKAAEQMFSQMFAADMMKQKEKSQDQLKNAQRFARLFSFVCPSKYIPGKQNWGAF
jgi:uncharacterized protein